MYIYTYKLKSIALNFTSLKQGCPCVTIIMYNLVFPRSSFNLVCLVLWRPAPLEFLRILPTHHKDTYKYFFHLTFVLKMSRVMRP